MIKFHEKKYFFDSLLVNELSLHVGLRICTEHVLIQCIPAMNGRDNLYILDHMNLGIYLVTLKC